MRIWLLPRNDIKPTLPNTFFWSFRKAEQISPPVDLPELFLLPKGFKNLASLGSTSCLGSKKVKTFRPINVTEMWCREVMWCDVMWCDVMWCDVMWGCCCSCFSSWHTPCWSKTKKNMLTKLRRMLKHDMILHFEAHRKINFTSTITCLVGDSAKKNFMCDSWRGTTQIIPDYTRSLPRTGANNMTATAWPSSGSPSVPKDPPQVNSMNKGLPDFTLISTHENEYGT